MKPNQKFLKQPKSFWANVRSISQEVGYTLKQERKAPAQVKVPTIEEISAAFKKLNLNSEYICNEKMKPTEVGSLLLEYFQFRADVINNSIQHSLMDAPEAEKEFNKLKKTLKPKCPIPMNKQKKAKKKPAYLTGMVNMSIEANIGKLSCDYDPRSLTTVTSNGVPLRTLARRVDGAFPNTVNPIAVWEIKEYYYTTTFGSRVADGVYETLLDGMEIEELRESENIDVRHYLAVDSKFTWWKCGRSYLCRIIDMLHMGYVDEVFFGKEVITEMPKAVKEWVKIYEERNKK